MKGNKGLYILLPVVFIVWGLIIYRLVKYVGQGNTPVPIPAFTSVNFEPEKLQEDTFSITANYRDPFKVATPQFQKQVSAVTSPSFNKNKANSAPTPAEPSIIFNGIIKNKKSNKTIALFKINGKRRLLSVGEGADGIKLIVVNSDSASYIWKGIKKNVTRRK